MTTAFCFASVGSFLACSLFTKLAHLYGYPLFKVSPTDYVGFTITGACVAIVATVFYVAAELNS